MSSSFCQHAGARSLRRFKSSHGASVTASGVRAPVSSAGCVAGFWAAAVLRPDDRRRLGADSGVTKVRA